MRPYEFKRIERLAAHEARFDMGDFMTKIGKSDMHSMTLEESMEFFRIAVASYRANLKKFCQTEAPF